MIKKSIFSFFAFAMLLCVNVYAGGKGKIVFSNKSIDAATGESLPPVTINVGDKIYCRVYLEKKLSTYKNYSGGYRINVKLNNNLYNCVNGKDYSEAEASSMTTFEFILNQAEGETTFKNPTLAASFAKLNEGSHIVKVSFILQGCIEDEAVFSSEFTINKTANSKIKFGTTFDKEVKAGMAQPDLEEKATTKIMVAENVIKLKIISEDWTINRKLNTGVILGRWIDVAILVKEKEQCLIRIYRLEQQFNGSGYQDSFGGYVGPAINNNNQYYPLHNKPVDCE